MNKAAMPLRNQNRTEPNLGKPNWNLMARAMQRAPFFAKGTEEAIEHGLRQAGGGIPVTRELHDYLPHKKYPNFCETCGYGRDEPLMHNS